MKKSTLIAVLLFISFFAFSQNEKTVVGEFCYYEQIDGQKSSGEAMPYTYHSRLELKFKSDYQISVKDMAGFANIIKTYSTQTTSSKVLLGEYKPETIAKGTKVADVKNSLKVYWDGKNLILEIPELTDMFGGATAANHTIFIPKECISKLVDCLKK
ncbi:hypothetical protein [Fulvivirga sp.]|uniref:hypothetical protein n=1 Tax=Fulvivirga sp. TaxID=1931237 RepID=UPI0032EEDDF0